uniref:Uncharacterized protein n=1 Tax=Oryza meridionalis TaxID=40149 RepID=A0A0E0DIT4_9ORYZ
MPQRRSRLGSFPSGRASVGGWGLVPFRLGLGLSMKKKAPMCFVALDNRSSGLCQCPSNSSPGKRNWAYQ